MLTYIILLPMLLHTPVIRGVNIEGDAPIPGIRAQVVMNLSYGDSLTWWVDRCAAIHALDGLCIVPIHGAPDWMLDAHGGLKDEYIGTWAAWAARAARLIGADYVIPWNEPDIGSCAYAEFFGCWGGVRADAYAQMVHEFKRLCPECKLVTGLAMGADVEPFLQAISWIAPDLYAAGFHDYAGYWGGMPGIPRHDLDRKVTLMQQYLPGTRLWLTEFNLITATDAPPADPVRFEQFQTAYIAYVLDEAPHYGIETAIGYTWYTGWRNASLREQIELLRQ